MATKYINMCKSRNSVPMPKDLLYNGDYDHSVYKELIWYHHISYEEYIILSNIMEIKFIKCNRSKNILEIRRREGRLMKVLKTDDLTGDGTINKDKYKDKDTRGQGD